MSTDTCSVDRAHWRENHVWSVARQAALAAAGWECDACGVTDWEDVLHVHHVEPVDRHADGYGPGCQHHQGNLVVLCETHHRMTHRGLRARPNTQLVLFANAA